MGLYIFCNKLTTSVLTSLFYASYSYATIIKTMGEEFTIELTQHIPIGNLNFYLDACSSMDAVNKRKLSGFDYGDI